MDLTGFSRNVEDMGKENVKSKDPVKQCVRDWEREREREGLREIAAPEDRDKDNGDEQETVRKQKKNQIGLGLSMTRDTYTSDTNVAGILCPGLNVDLVPAEVPDVGDL
jgi:hypothetical protein